MFVPTRFFGLATSTTAVSGTTCVARTALTLLEPILYLLLFAPVALAEALTRGAEALPHRPKSPASGSLHSALIAETLACTTLRSTHSRSVLHRPAHDQLLERGGDLNQLLAIQGAVAVLVELLEKHLNGRIGVGVGRSRVCFVPASPLLLAAFGLLSRKASNGHANQKHQRQTRHHR